MLRLCWALLSCSFYFASAGQSTFLGGQSCYSLHVQVGPSMTRKFISGMVFSLTSRRGVLPPRQATGHQVATAQSRSSITGICLRTYAGPRALPGWFCCYPYMAPHTSSVDGGKPMPPNKSLERTREG